MTQTLRKSGRSTAYNAETTRFSTGHKTMAMRTTTQLNMAQLPIPALPTELWLQILELASIHEAEHLWISVRRTSREFRDYVERLSVSTYLPQFAISLSLPRRNTSDTTPRCWPGAVPKAQIIMSFDNMALNERYATFISPMKLKHGEERASVEELRVSGVLPKARLLEAPAWVYPSKSYMAGRPLHMPMDIEWGDSRKQ
jgi:hypothetical protein